MNDAEIERLVANLAWRGPSAFLDERVTAAMQSQLHRRRRRGLVASLMAAGIAAAMALPLVQWCAQPRLHSPAAVSGSGRGAGSLPGDPVRQPSPDMRSRFARAFTRPEVQLACIDAICRVRRLTGTSTPLERIEPLASSAFALVSRSGLGWADATPPAPSEKP